MSALNALADDLGLLNHELNRRILKVWRVAILAKNPLDESSKIRTDAVANMPVNGRVLSHRRKELPSD